MGTRYQEAVLLKLPTGLREAIDRAADAVYTKRTDFIRRAIVERLSRDSVSAAVHESNPQSMPSVTHKHFARASWMKVSSMGNAPSCDANRLDNSRIGQSGGAAPAAFMTMTLSICR